MTFLFATEMWERFSYYGMRALLVLYMVKYLLLPEQPRTSSGSARCATCSNACSGRSARSRSPRRSTASIPASFISRPLFGGSLADRVLGQHRTVMLGADADGDRPFHDGIRAAVSVGALTVLILGNGAFKPNISTQVGGLYAPGDRRRDRAYSIFYVGINVGAFLAPLVCGTLGEELGWHYGFAAAGVGMTIALAIYLYALP